MRYKLTEDNDEIDWRIYFQNREYHSILSCAVLDLLKIVIHFSRDGGLISERKASSYKQRIVQARNADLSQVYKLIYMDCETQVLIRGHYNSKLIWLLRALEKHDSEYVEQNRDKIIFLSWCLREAEILCKFLKEARNAQAHDTNSRQHLGWLISIPSNILRLIEICPTSQLSQDRVRELEQLCREHINRALSPNNENSIREAPEKSALPNQLQLSENKQKIDAVEAKLDLILERVSTLTSDVNSVSDNNIVAQNEDDPNNSELEIEPEIYSKIDYLTPKMARDQLIKLSKKADLSMDEDLVFSPNEKLLQIAIIEEVIFHKIKNISEIFGLPDVNWRYKRYSNSMEQQLKTLADEIQSILDRAIWE